MTRALGAVLLATGLSSGCLVVSLHPAYDAASLIVDEGLVGSWQGVADATSLQIERGEWRSYRIRYANGTDAGEWAAYLTVVGGGRFLDVTVEHGEDHGPFMVPAHGLFRVQRRGDTLVLAGLNYDRLRARAEEDPDGPMVLDGKQNVLLLQRTPDLRAWLATQLDSPDLFEPPTRLRRATVSP